MAGASNNVVHRWLLGGHFTVKFGSALREILRDDNVIEALRSAGMTPEMIGTHSLRKGGATFVTSGSTLCNIVAVCLRGGWSMGVQGARSTIHAVLVLLLRFGFESVMFTTDGVLFFLFA